MRYGVGSGTYPLHIRCEVWGDIL